MTERPYNPDDLAFLISQELDGELSADQRRRLDDARSGSTDLRRESDEIAAVDHLLGRWAQRRVDLDWTAMAGLIDARVRGDDAGLDEVDALLQRWGHRQVAPTDLSVSVLKRIRTQDRDVRSRRLVFRLSAPLAMAAALALVVFGTTWFQPLAGPVTYVAIRTTVVETTPAGEAPRTVVSFGRPNADAVARDTTPVSIGFITLGAGPESNAGEIAPL